MNKAKLYLATPSHDMQVHCTYAWSVVNMLLKPPCEFEVPTATYDGDLVRVRSRFVQDFLESTSTHLLFIDSDIDFSSTVVAGMLATGEDFVAAPYRRKREKTEYSILRLPGEPTIDRERMLVQIAGIGLGMALLSRAMLERMVREYAPTLTFADEPHPGQKRDTVALFQLALVEQQDASPPSLFSEDYSFCRRWLKIGGKIWLYLGAGAPVGHHGSARFGGTPADFGIGDG